MPTVWTLLSHVQMKLMDVTITSARTATLTKCAPTLFLTCSAAASLLPHARAGTKSPMSMPTQKLSTRETKKPIGVRMGSASFPGTCCTVQRT